MIISDQQTLQALSFRPAWSDPTEAAVWDDADSSGLDGPDACNSAVLFGFPSAQAQLDQITQERISHVARTVP